MFDVSRGIARQTIQQKRGSSFAALTSETSRKYGMHLRASTARNSYTAYRPVPRRHLRCLRTCRNTSEEFKLVIISRVPHRSPLHRAGMQFWVRLKLLSITLRRSLVKWEKQTNKNAESGARPNKQLKTMSSSFGEDLRWSCDGGGN